MRLISWNVNGLRAVHRKGNLAEVFACDPDILCLQEIKAEKEQLPEEVRHTAGYYSYFESSKEKRGYSGVATYTKREPANVEHGLGIERFDKEGRVLTTYFNDFTLLNVYFPQGGGGDERFQYKLDFYDAFLEHIERLRADGHSIIFCGDVNVAHEEIDLARPEQNHEHPCFRPEVREWIDHVFSLGYIDTFRHFYPRREGAYTYWDMQTRARDRNVGWRIDYFAVSPDLAPRLKNAAIYDSIHGSDHCPVVLDIE
jgi:exodeoxyribonuclease-3